MAVDAATVRARSRNSRRRPRAITHRPRASPAGAAACSTPPRRSMCSTGRRPRAFTVGERRFDVTARRRDAAAGAAAPCRPLRDLGDDGRAYYSSRARRQRPPAEEAWLERCEGPPVTSIPRGPRECARLPAGRPKTCSPSTTRRCTRRRRRPPKPARRARGAAQRRGRAHPVLTQSAGRRPRLPFGSHHHPRRTAPRGALPPSRRGLPAPGPDDCLRDRRLAPRDDGRLRGQTIMGTSGRRRSRPASTSRPN